MNDLNLFQVALSAWIIQDGNYSDFECDQVTRFALEFDSENGLRLLRQAPEAPSLRPLGDGFYAVEGTVSFRSRDAWVIDLGALKAFQLGKSPRRLSPGKGITGEVRLGVDPFFYYESLFKQRSMPPLIYDWKIERIEIETAPFVKSFEPGIGVVNVRDASKRRRIPIEKTDAWNDDGGHGDYLLTCRRHSIAAHRHLDDSDT